MIKNLLKATALLWFSILFASNADKYNRNSFNILNFNNEIKTNSIEENLSLNFNPLKENLKVELPEVIFTKLPINKQLVGRNLTTNIGILEIEGTANNTPFPYELIRVELYRENVLQNTYNQPLNYLSNTANFSFNIPILAELANYTIKIYGVESTNAYLITQVVELVAGDAYIVQGQSNAVAKNYVEEDSADNLYLDPFIRVYLSHSTNIDYISNTNTWFYGSAKGGNRGHTGEWPLKLAKLIVDAQQIPVAIFNGGHGGQLISFFIAPPDYETSLESNYGRLYHRINKTGLKNFVRGVFWSQGEANSNATGVLEDYKGLFYQIKDSWLNDYPNIERFYIFQTKNGCGKFIPYLMMIKEAQRQLAIENSDTSIISTAAMQHYTDGCHFAFTDGYEIFADRLFKQVNRDLYGATYSEEIDSPVAYDAFLPGGNTLVVKTTATSLNLNNIAENFELSDGGSATITEVNVSGGNIIFTLSETPNPNIKISYLAPYTSDVNTWNFIENSGGLELVSFNKMPMNTSLSSDNYFENNFKIYPNPSNKGVLNIVAPSINEALEVTLMNLVGQVIFTQQFSNLNETIAINTQNIANGTYFLKIKQQSNLATSKVVINN